MNIREARRDELSDVGALTYAAYAHDAAVDDGYAPDLRAADRRADEAVLLVAVDGHEVLGTATYVPDGGPWGEVAAGPAEAEFRMLAVAPEARGQGVAEALVREMLRRARTAGKARMVLSSSTEMRTAHRLYERLGFSRAPDRDWSPHAGIDLIAYALELGWCDRCGQALAEGGHGACATARELEPPRYCTRCARRLVVQVRPAAWTARCAEHGETADHS